MSSSGVNIAGSGDVDSRSVGGGDSGLSSSDQVGGKPSVYKGTSDDAGDTRPDVFCFTVNSLKMSPSSFDAALL